MQTLNPAIAGNASPVTPQQLSLKLNSLNPNKSTAPTYARDQQAASTQESRKSVSEVVSQLNQQSLQPKPIRLFVHRPNELHYGLDKESDPKLSSLLEEYKGKISSVTCDDELCRNLKTCTHKLLQGLLEKIDTQTSNLQSIELSNNNYSSQYTSEAMERNGLLDLVVEKDKRIQDLEKLLELQKRLRMQDANQVEEKAARIKEWVANKLKELENQNRQLRDQNKKHKETVDTLSNRLASLSHLCTPKRTWKTEMTKVPDRLTSVSQSEVGSHPNLPVAQSRKKSLDSTGFRRSNLENQSCFTNSPIDSQKTNLTSLAEPCGNNITQEDGFRAESPIYDSVSFDKNNQRKPEETAISEPIPPPPPLHQRDKWELELYGLADEIFSSLVKKPEDDSNIDNDSLATPDSYSENRISRKSTSSVRNDLISLVKPNFTTIDGNNVVDDESVLYSNYDDTSVSNELSSCQSKVKYPMSDKERELELLKQEMEDQPVLMTFDSPIRSRTGKECLLKTQSVRKSIESERLFNFISSDLVKRGWLIKPATLKNQSRWIVLKNFHLHVYKNEVDELSKLKPMSVIKLNYDCSVQLVNNSGESNFPFRLFYNDKYLQLIADSSLARDEWVRILTVAINISNIELQMLTKRNASCEGLLSITRHGHTRRCYAILINHVVFFLRSMTDPTPLSYLSLKEAKIREITNNFDHNLEDVVGDKSSIQDTSLAIYPKYSLNPDPMYMTMGSQQDTDKWLHYLTIASGIEQSFGTSFEQTLTRFMVSRSILGDSSTSGRIEDSSSIRYIDKPILEPLTTLPNETLRTEALELFKSILLITRIPVEPVAIDYHVSLVQNCLSRFLKTAELRNEFFAQLIKQSNYIPEKFTSPKLSLSSSGCSVELDQQHRNSSSVAARSITNHDISDSSSIDLKNFAQTSPTYSKETDFIHNEPSTCPPSDKELLQVMQIIAITVSLNLPKGRIRWWLIDLLNRIANPSTDIGKYALYTLRAIERTKLNGSRENVPSRTELIGIILRNPYDHSHPHSLPVSFSDGSYLVIGTDGSTTVEEFISTLVKEVDIRESPSSDFYLFADDPSGSKDLHILEPYRKVLDIVGWWEQAFRLNNHGKYETTKVIKLIFKKRLVLKAEHGETQQERSLIVHQFHQEVSMQKIHLNDNLIMELAALIAQKTYGNIVRLENAGSVEQILEKVVVNLLPKYSSQSTSQRKQDNDILVRHRNNIGNRWKQLSDKSPEDCVRVYLNCIRRLNLCKENYKQVSI